MEFEADAVAAQSECRFLQADPIGRFLINFKQQRLHFWILKNMTFAKRQRSIDSLRREQRSASKSLNAAPRWLIFKCWFENRRCLTIFVDLSWFIDCFWFSIPPQLSLCRHDFQTWWGAGDHRTGTWPTFQLHHFGSKLKPHTHVYIYIYTVYIL